jgi:hypothetical protein
MVKLVVSFNEIPLLIVVSEVDCCRNCYEDLQNKNNEIDLRRAERTVLKDFPRVKR